MIEEKDRHKKLEKETYLHASSIHPMETNNGFHSAGKDREDHIRACSYPEARPLLHVFLLLIHQKAEAPFPLVLIQTLSAGAFPFLLNPLG